MKLYSFIIFLMVIGCGDQGREVTYFQSEEYEKNNFPLPRSLSNVTTSSLLDASSEQDKKMVNKIESKI